MAMSLLRWFTLLLLATAPAQPQWLKPDLVIWAIPPITVTPSTVEPAATVQLSAWSVKNQGDAASVAFSNGFYLSTDSVITPADTYLEGNSNPSLLPDSSTSWPSSTLTVPPGTAPGTYYLGILADSTNVAAESDESNNFVSVPLTVVPGRPVISAEGGVVNAASFLPGAASATWIAIFGANLAPSTRIWGESDFVDNKLPTQLEGVSVNINGKPGYLYYISPTQINVLAPDDPTLGPIEVEVITALGKSDPVVVQKDWVSPAFFMFYPGEQKYVAAVHLDGTYVGKAGLFEGAVPTRPVKPGDVIMLFGNGFGPTDPSCPTEALVGEAAPLSMPVTVRIGGSSALVHFVGLVSSGLYQFNVTIPEVPDGDQPVVAEIAGFQSQDGAFITVQPDVAPFRVQEDTLHEGPKTYACETTSSTCWTCWREDGRVSGAAQSTGIFPDIEANSPKITAMLSDIGIPASPAAGDDEIWSRTRTVWSWLQSHTVLPGELNFDQLLEYRNTLDHWPSTGDFAHMFATWGGFPWGASCTCMCRAQTLATLLYRAGVPKNSMAIAEARWKASYSQHMYVVLKLGCHWFYLDPSVYNVPELPASPECVGSGTADYQHPIALCIIPGSSLAKPMLVSCLRR